jgi:hypothetical protein
MIVNINTAMYTHTNIFTQIKLNIVPSGIEKHFNSAKMNISLNYI